ncbi:MAG TPA: hypothetical protein EYP39_02000 [Ghiorsea sp.]|nr:hypothetical protein [Ghiorsea sp.]HIP07343.1 hypothetical protein [Mariprofundaceae bacterium]
MFNHVENPKEMLEWLSQRNHHIPFDDLAHLLDANTIHEDTGMTGDFDEESDLLSEFSFD